MKIAWVKGFATYKHHVRRCHTSLPGVSAILLLPSHFVLLNLFMVSMYRPYFLVAYVVVEPIFKCAVGTFESPAFAIRLQLCNISARSSFLGPRPCDIPTSPSSCISNTCSNRTSLLFCPSTAPSRVLLTDETLSYPRPAPS